MNMPLRQAGTTPGPNLFETDPVSPWGLLRLRQQLEQGLPLTPRPYQTLAEQTGLTERQVMEAIEQWQEQGLIKRLGLVVKHRTLGYNANAMVVWNVPDEYVAELGARMAKVPFITLCYQRPRQLPDWPYNLFCMIHGVSRDRVQAQLKRLIADFELTDIPHSVLFSTKAYRQRGGRYVSHG
jgi:DNA-binding Lrp family transcriptional regulator